MITPEMIPNVDVYIVNGMTYFSMFVIKNPITIAAGLAVLKAGAVLTKSTTDDKIYTMIVNFLNIIIPGRYGTKKKTKVNKKKK